MHAFSHSLGTFPSRKHPLNILNSHSSTHSPALFKYLTAISSISGYLPTFSLLTNLLFHHTQCQHHSSGLQVPIPTALMLATLLSTIFSNFFMYSTHLLFTSSIFTNLFLFLSSFPTSLSFHLFPEHLLVSLHILNKASSLHLTSLFLGLPCHYHYLHFPPFFFYIYHVFSQSFFDALSQRIRQD